MWLETEMFNRRGAIILNDNSFYTIILDVALTVLRRLFALLLWRLLKILASVDHGNHHHWLGDSKTDIPLSLFCGLKGWERQTCILYLETDLPLIQPLYSSRMKLLTFLVSGSGVNYVIAPRYQGEVDFSLFSTFAHIWQHFFSSFGMISFYRM